MSKYCSDPGCMGYNIPQEGTSCNYCGKEFVDDTNQIPKPSYSVPKNNENEGGNGISVNRVTNTSDSHDTISNTTIIQNYTSSREELTLKDRKNKYREFCSANILNGIITSDVRKKLDNKALELDLSQDDKRSIEKIVKHSSVPQQGLDSIDRDNLDLIKKGVAKNQKNFNEWLPKLEAMSTYDDDEVQYYHNMLQCVYSTWAIIQKYENRDQDIYWQTFWASVAYSLNGQKEKAEKVFRELKAYPKEQGNMYLLQSVEPLLNSGMNIHAASLFLEKVNKQSSLLEPLYNTVSFLIKNGGKKTFSNSSEINFYLENLFGVKSVTPFCSAGVYSASNSELFKDRFDDVQDESARQAAASVPKKTVSISPFQPILEEKKKKSNSSFGKIILGAAIAVCVILFWPKNKDAQKLSAPSATEVTVAPATESNGAPVSNTNATTTNSSSNNIAKPSTSKSGITTTSTNSSKTSTNKSSESIQTTTSPKDSESSQSLTSKAEEEKVDPIAELKKKADTGDKDAQYDLGMRYYEGNGVSKNYSTAFQYLKPLAEAGYTNAFFPVADMYHRGNGVSKDRNTAEKWYKKAAEAGNNKAKRILMDNF